MIKRKTQLAEELWRVGSELWELGQNAIAFRVMLQSAACGSVSGQLTVGYFFDCGIGTKKNRCKALEWYRKAARRGDSSAANNIATVYEAQGQPRRAELWYLRAISLGNVSSHLGLAKLYSKRAVTKKKARKHLLAVRRSQDVAEETKEAAEQLLRKLEDK
jgi:TPR repeat protein